MGRSRKRYAPNVCDVDGGPVVTGRHVARGQPAALEAGGDSRPAGMLPVRHATKGCTLQQFALWLRQESPPVLLDDSRPRWQRHQQSLYSHSVPRQNIAEQAERMMAANVTIARFMTASPLRRLIPGHCGSHPNAAASDDAA